MRTDEVTFGRAATALKAKLERAGGQRGTQSGLYFKDASQLGCGGLAVNLHDGVRVLDRRIIKRRHVQKDGR